MCNPHDTNHFLKYHRHERAKVFALYFSYVSSPFGYVVTYAFSLCHAWIVSQIFFVLLVLCRHDRWFCCGKEMTAHLVGYTHSTQILDCIYHCNHCGKQCSDLRHFTKERDNRFKDLEPAPKQPSVWYQHPYKHSKRKFEWRLNCRGRVWSRCEYCRAIFLQATGKRGEHSKERCSQWRQLKKKRNPDWLQEDQVPPLKRRAATTGTTVVSSLRGADAAPVHVLNDPFLDDVFVEELCKSLMDDTFVERGQDYLVVDDVVVNEYQI